MQVPVQMGKRSCGCLWAEQRGLYTAFRAEVQAEELSRLFAVFEDGEIALGIPAPEQGRMVLRVSVPTGRLPEGRLLRGCLRPKDSGWTWFPGGTVGGLSLPRGYVMGNRYRFPWSPGEQLPCEPLLCFFRYVEEDQGTFLELRLSDTGVPGA